MENFIQKVLACGNMEVADNLIEAFPIISVIYQNEKRYLLLLQFQNHGISNYLVFGLFSKECEFNRDSLIEWLDQLYHLILEKPGSEMYYQRLEQFFRSRYFKQLLYTQEGFDMIQKKEYFTSGGCISRTVGVDCHILEDHSLEFGCELTFFSEHQFLDGDFFRDYQDYEDHYFLNFEEYHLMSYQNILAYLKLNAKRFEKQFKLGSFEDEAYLFQLLDSYLARAQGNKLFGRI